MFLAEQDLGYSVGYGLPFVTSELHWQISEEMWEPALDAGGVPRPGAGVAEITHLITGEGWPEGMRMNRMFPGARYTESTGVLQIPMPKDSSQRSPLASVGRAQASDQDPVAWAGSVLEVLL